jgi:hypothetical protein
MSEETPSTKVDETPTTSAGEASTSNIEDTATTNKVESERDRPASRKPSRKRRWPERRRRRKGHLKQGYPNNYMKMQDLITNEPIRTQDLRNRFHSALWK